MKGVGKTMPIPEAYLKVVEKLLELSRAGVVNWQESAKANAFTVAMSTGALRIGLIGSDPFGSPAGYRCELVGPGGTVADGFIVNRGEHDYPKLGQLYELGRRKAKKIDQLISSIEWELESGGAGGGTVGESNLSDFADDIPF